MTALEGAPADGVDIVDGPQCKTGGGDAPSFRIRWNPGLPLWENRQWQLNQRVRQILQNDGSGKETMRMLRSFGLRGYGSKDEDLI